MSASETPDVPRSGLLVTTRVAIRGMTAIHAVRAVYTALTPVPGIERADVALGEAVIEHDGRATEDALRSAIETAGYEVVAVREDRRRLRIR